MSDIMYVKGEYKDYYYEDDSTIFGFFEDNRYLSNFHKCTVYYDGLPWPSSEHAYMAAKCKHSHFNAFDTFPTYNSDENGEGGTHYSEICDMKCHEVKKWGMTVDLRDDWEDVKFNIMFEICLDKFNRNSDIKEKLIATGSKELIEANAWKDTYYGFDINLNRGENNLGKILMSIRGLLKLKIIYKEYI